MDQVAGLPLGAAGEQLVCRVVKGDDLLGYVVVDSTIDGHSSGGLRLMPSIDEAQVRSLARAMTLKYGFVGLPQGGAKAGVIGHPEAPREEKLRRLAAFGQAIAPLLRTRVYLPGADMGTDGQDILHLLRAAEVCTERREWQSNHSGYYTALTAFVGAREAARQLGMGLEGRTVAIEGFGKVGSALATLMAEAGARVVAISTVRGAIYNPGGLDVDCLTRLAAEQGSRVVDLYREAERIELPCLVELPVDILSPCAYLGSIHAGNVSRVSARIISAGANIPVTQEAERSLFERGVISLPDFVTNCGGVLGGRMEFASVSSHQIIPFIDHHIGSRITGLLRESEQQHSPPRQVAEEQALRRFERMRSRSAGKSMQQRLFRGGLELYRRGWIPRPVIGAVSLPYFTKIVSEWPATHPPHDLHSPSTIPL